MRVLAAENAVNRAVIFCSDYHAMQTLAKEYPRARKGWLVEKQDFEKDGIQAVVTRAVQARCNVLAPEVSQVTPALVAACHEAKLLLWTWTVDSGAMMEQLIRMGVDGIVTDDPQLLNTTLARLKAPKESVDRRGPGSCERGEKLNHADFPC